MTGQGGSKKNPGPGIALGLLASVAFGLIPLFTLPMLHAGVAPETAVLYRFGLGAILLAPLLPVLGIRLSISLQMAARLALLAFFYFLDVQFFFYAFRYLPSGIVATLEFLFPVFVMLIMIAGFGEKFRWPALVAMLLALPGIWLLSGASQGLGQLANAAPGQIWTGVVLSLLAALFNALYIAGCQIARVDSLNPLLATFYIMLFGAFCCVLLTGARGELRIMPDWQTFALALALALVTAVISNLLMIMAIKRVGSIFTALLGVVEPLTAVFTGVFIFNEKLTGWMGVGVALVLLASVVVIADAARGGRTDAS